MKKITLLLGCLAFVFTAQAQSVLFEQVSANAVNFVSGYSDVSQVGVFSTDDFDLTVPSDIHSVTIYGMQPDNDFDTAYMTSFSLFIYSDSGGMPSDTPLPGVPNSLLQLNLSPSDPALTVSNPGTSLFNFTVDIVTAEGAPLSLPAGTYWIVAAPHMNIDVATININGDDRLWYWFLSPQLNLSDAQFVDPNNFFGAGWTSWTPISSFPTSSPSNQALSFTIMGDNQAAIVDNSPLETRVWIYPNPASDKLHINMPANLELESAVIVDLLGKSTKIKIGNDQLVDVSSMAAGVYFLKLETNQGELVKKFIKK